VQWQRDTSIVCPDLNDIGSSITVTSSNFTGRTITGLEPGNRYTITVIVSNGAGSGPVSNAVTAMTIATAPSAPPPDLTVTDVNSSTITVEWGEVPCINQNGAITGYSVQYGVMESGNTEIVNVDGATVNEATITGLMPSTTYSIQVAAVNRAGTREYSDPEMAET
ncbi:Protein sidekick-2, partial [Geodia barretti]